jgi:glucose-6-phosphate isomerase
MKEITFSYENSLISDDEIINLNKIISEEIKQLKDASEEFYDNDRASINLAFDKEAIQNVKNVINEKGSLNPSYLVVAGIGGSILGTIAVQEAVLGKLYNCKKTDLKVLYADNIDSDLISDIISIIEPALINGEKVIINGVSKTGGTTETIANFEVLINVLKKHCENYEKYVVVTTDKDSKFYNFAHEQGFNVLEIPKKVGGRYSVFSPVGLFPLGLLGVNIDKLLEGARLIRDKCLDNNIFNNPAALSASLIYLHKNSDINIHDLFLFSSDLESIGKWYRQLMSESIGKEYDRVGNQIFTGITPTVSIGSVDLHSMAQLYLAGPYDKFTSFINIESNKNNTIIPDFDDYSKLIEIIQGKSLNEIMNAILKGVQTSFIKGKRPFMHIILPDKSEFSIGQLLQMKMMEMMYLGFLMGVNPFDQPNVVAYKNETKKILEGRIYE